MRVEASTWASEVEGVASAYLTATRGCAQAALRRVLTDALADLAEIERGSYAALLTLLSIHEVAAGPIVGRTSVIDGDTLDIRGKGRMIERLY